MATVLIVEDEFAIAQILEEVLSDAGHVVVLAANGQQGLDCLAAGLHPDLIISDYMMPVLDGPNMIKTMRKNEGQRDIPYAFMSAMPEASVRDQIDDYIAFIHKPFKLSAMVELVACVVNSPRPNSNLDPH